MADDACCDDQEAAAASSKQPLQRDPSWSEVYQAGCHHTPREWINVAAGLSVVLLFLYFFLLGLELLGSGAKVLSGCRAGALLGDNHNPMAGLSIGVLATVLLQSSSTTTSIVVTLVPDVVSVQQGIYIIMGANIGTSVTNTIVAMGQIGSQQQLERAFAGATVHDIFNYLCVAVLLPVEVTTHYLLHLTDALVSHYDREKGEKWEGPVKRMVDPVAHRVILSNKDMLTAVAQGTGSCQDGDGFYPLICEGGVETYQSCTRVGLIACDPDTNRCPIFFQQDASASDDKLSGGVVFFLGIFILFTCIAVLVLVLQKLLMGISMRVVYKATQMNGYVAIVIGAGITTMVQSSSITTSVLTPLVGIGVLDLQQMYPLTLGANIGTTITGILSALVSGKRKSMQVALAHLFFNVSGVALFYPIPFMRQIPMRLARRLGQVAALWRTFPLLYIFAMFFLFPLVVLGISSMFDKKMMGLTVLGSFIVVLLALAGLYTIYWFNWGGGNEYCTDCFAQRERRRLAMEDFPDEMEFLRETVMALVDHTGMSLGELTGSGDMEDGQDDDLSGLELKIHSDDCTRSNSGQLEDRGNTSQNHRVLREGSDPELDLRNQGSHSSIRFNEQPSPIPQDRAVLSETLRDQENTTGRQGSSGSFRFGERPPDVPVVHTGVMNFVDHSEDLTESVDEAPDFRVVERPSKMQRSYNQDELSHFDNDARRGGFRFGKRPPGMPLQPREPSSPELRSTGFRFGERPPEMGGSYQSYEPTTDIPRKTTFRFGARPPEMTGGHAVVERVIEDGPSHIGFKFGERPPEYSTLSRSLNSDGSDSKNGGFRFGERPPEMR